ncbi:MAG: NnrU family protein [Myxococcota bacterium]|jgi:uncharacterized membrane protein|nr:NnrU family protein [Myxococcota bacterium]
MISLVLATLFFVGIHLFVSGTKLRDAITDRIGELPYMGLFAVASLVGMIWMCSAYSDAPSIELWGDLPGAPLFALVGTFVGFVLAVLGFTTPSPTAAGGEALLDSDDPCKGILRVTRHPAMWGIAIWAFVHIPANGDAASLVFFAGLCGLALSGPGAIDRKRARKLGDRWERFAAVTSNVPFGAIRDGRNQLVFGELGMWRLVASVVVWAGFLASHDALFDVAPFAF